MGYLLRGLRIASYLAAALGLILTFVGTNNNALLFYGVRLLVMGLVGIGATALLRDTYLEDEEEEEYYSLLPTPQLKTPKVKIQKAMRTILSRWRALSPEKRGWILIGIFGIPGVLLTMICCVTLITF